MAESQIAHSNTLPKQNWYDIAALAATLDAKQVPYLRSTTEAEPLNISLPTLIATLAQHQDPRVRESLRSTLMTASTPSHFIAWVKIGEVKTSILRLSMRLRLAGFGSW